MNIKQKVQALKPWYPQYSLVDRYRHVKHCEAIRRYFDRPLPKQDRDTDYIACDTPFHLYLNGFRLKVEITVEPEDYYICFSDYGEFGEHVDRIDQIPDYCHHAMKNVYGKYYVSSHFNDSSKPFYRTIVAYNKQYSKQESFLKTVAQIKSEMDYLWRIEEGLAGMYYIRVSVSYDTGTGNVELSSSSIGMIEIDGSRDRYHIDPIEEIVYEYDLIGEAMGYALDRLTELKALAV